MKTKTLSKSVICALCLLLVLAMVVPYMANTASAATQTKEIKGMKYTPDSYTATTGAGIWLRDENDQPLIYIPKGAKVEVLGKYTEKCSLESRTGNRSVMEYGGYTGHARDGALTNRKSTNSNQEETSSTTKTIKGMEYEPSKYEAITTYGIWLRDENDQKLVYIVPGSKVTVFGVYTEKSSVESITGNRSVMEYGKYTGHARHGGLVDKKPVNESSTGGDSNDTPTGATKTIKGMKYIEGEYYAITGGVITLRDQYDNEIIDIPKGSLVLVRGEYAETCRVGNIVDEGNRSVMEFGGHVGHARHTNLTKTTVPAFTKTSLSNRYAVTNTSKDSHLNMRSGASNTSPLVKELKQYTVVFILGVSTENPNRLVVVYANGKVGTILNNVILIDDALCVSIERQKTMVFRNGKLLGEFNCVTGNVSKGWDTHKGAFRVKNRLTDAYMAKYDVWADHWVGLEEAEAGADGKHKSYGEGFHDSSRTTFGGNVYKTNGSHGCINQREEDAKFIYDNSYVGEPIYVSET